METKELEIVAPEGYEIDKENSTFEKIIFKKKDDVPRSWDGYAYNTDVFGKYYISGTDAEIIQVSGHLLPAYQKKNICNTKEEAEAFVALMQLRQLRKAWVGDWEPDWKSVESKGTIICDYDNVTTYLASYASSPMSFPTQKMTREFLECFKDLLEKAKMLL